MDDSVVLTAFRENGVRLSDLFDGVNFDNPPEGVELTNAQLWGRLLRMERSEREKFFDLMRKASASGRICDMMDHRGQLEARAIMVDALNQRSLMFMIAAQTQAEEAEAWRQRAKRLIVIAHNWRAQTRHLIGYLGESSRG